MGFFFDEMLQRPLAVFRTKYYKYARKFSNLILLWAKHEDVDIISINAIFLRTKNKWYLKAGLFKIEYMDSNVYAVYSHTYQHNDLQIQLLVPHTVLLTIPDTNG